MKNKPHFDTTATLYDEREKKIRRALSVLIDPEVIAHYGKTQAERTAINTYVRAWRDSEFPEFREQ